MERLAVAATEEQVADGRPRDIFEAKEPFRLVSEYFIGKVRYCSLEYETRSGLQVIKLSSFCPNRQYCSAVFLHTSITSFWFICLKQKSSMPSACNFQMGFILRFPSNDTGGSSARVRHGPTVPLQHQPHHRRPHGRVRRGTRSLRRRAALSRCHQSAAGGGAPKLFNISI